MRYIFLLTYICLSLIAKSEKVITITNDAQNSISIPQYVYILEDPEGKLTFEQVILSRKEKDFVLNRQESLNFGFTNSVYWIKFSMINKTTKVQNLVFSIQYPLLASIDFISFKKSKIEKHTVTGEKYVFNSREINNRNFLFDLVLEPNVPYDYYVKVSTDGSPMQLPMSISPYQKYLDSDNKSLLFEGLFTGLFLFAIFFNLFLLLITRDILNAYYTIYVALLTLFLLNISGLNYQYLWPNNIWLQNHSTLLFSGLANLFLILFAKRFFNFKRYFYRINKFIKWYMIFVFLLVVFSLFDGLAFIISKLLVNIVSLTTIVILFIISIRGLTKKNNMHYYFVFAFAFFLLGVGIYVFNNLGLISNSYISVLALRIGFVIEVILLMFAVVHKYKNIELLNNRKLEEKVRKRTKELERQKEELIVTKKEVISQRDEIMKQHTKFLKQTDIIVTKNKEINDSIAYARIIQNAVLPPKSKLDKSLVNYFILNKPKDTLGGDFFWHYEKNERIYIVVADCTGHGIPGAMISMLGIAALNEIILKEEYLSPARILDRLSNIVKKSLHQNGQFGESKDGMDINVCMIDKVTKTMLSAGSNNPVYIYREKNNFKEKSFTNYYKFEDNYLISILPDKLTIGYNDQANLSFRDKKIDLRKDDMVYLFSDGYVDQFGGVKGKKFKRKRFRQLLSDNAMISDDKVQFEHINQNFNSWKGQNEQVDDILVLGFRV